MTEAAAVLAGHLVVDGLRAALGVEAPGAVYVAVPALDVAPGAPWVLMLAGDGRGRAVRVTLGAGVSPSEGAVRSWARGVVDGLVVRRQLAAAVDAVHRQGRLWGDD